MEILLLILLVLACGSFALAAFGVAARFNLIALGLCFWVLVELLRQLTKV